MDNSILLIGNFLSASMVTRHVCEDMAKQLTARNWNILRASTKLPSVPRALDMLMVTWRSRREYDLAHIECYSGRAFAWAECVGCLLRWLNKPFVLTLHSGNFPRFAEKCPGRVRRLLRAASVVTAPSAYLQESMKSYREDLRLLPNAIDLSAYTFRRREQLRPQLIWLRGFLGYYNPFLGPKVVAKLVKEFPDVHLCMLGPDKGDGSLSGTQQLSKDLQVLEHVTFPGGVPKGDVPRRLNDYDIFLNTTNRDNTPVSVMEAMACGLNVVSTSVDGIPYLLRDGHDALLVPADDEHSMAAAVRRLLLEPNLAAALSQNARAKVAQFDWAVVLPQWEQIYRALIANPTAIPAEAMA